MSSKNKNTGKVTASNKIKLVIGMPCYAGQLFATTLHSLIDLHRLCDQKGIEIYLHTLTNESLIQRARNRIVSDFMKSDGSHLLFLDSDVGFDPYDVIRLLEADKPIIGGVYPRKCINWESIKKAVLLNPNITDEEMNELGASFVLGLDPNNLTIDLHRPSKVKELGTGFLMIKRHVFDDILANEKCADAIRHFEVHTESGADEIRYAFFQALPDEHGRMMSEDYFFAWLYKTYAGGEIYTLLDINLTHTGTYTFKGNAKLQAIYQSREQKLNNELSKTL